MSLKSKTKSQGLKANENIESYVTITLIEEDGYVRLGYERRWIFQCKKYSKFPTSTNIINEINTAKQHYPDFWILVVPLNPTASQIDYIDRLDKSNPFKIGIITLVDIESMLHQFPEAKDILLTGRLTTEGAE
ncbi:hypothetical protein AJ85_20075 [Alkalihalobacillus alcalophilus ATCC 27647 = CGMCC 1.3604]|uniref:Restriction endonuclease type IV Mrr domain-containing protein n=1 Tax=Alkalihalobacillus alcalophilus ATCC 27647 = CGMCC 1.3604 TaxID=1218173 RepID=A0A4S4JXD4_ALKAL|nr:hypothetical protein [Alkalihalobacillus alcalophilus]MED1562069.1 hypothetical protein [Alkalihalobacillus alcalophilus]THG89007.1 hypothetical protein AJ85_20075 [Alkalihalobacillus alcalophilus ATCC 27647 = CGMCC 1.3604]